MKVLTIFLISMISLQAEAVFLNHCSNYATNNQPVSYMYESCVNRNFREIEMALENKVYLRHCMNFGEKVQYSFTNCINSNFRDIQRELSTFINYCVNFDQDELGYTFQSCVNRNYREIQRDLDQK